METQNNIYKVVERQYYTIARLQDALADILGVLVEAGHEVPRRTEKLLRETAGPAVAAKLAPVASARRPRHASQVGDDLLSIASSHSGRSSSAANAIATPRRSIAASNSAALRPATNGARRASGRSGQSSGNRQNRATRTPRAELRNRRRAPAAVRSSSASRGSAASGSRGRRLAQRGKNTRNGMVGGLASLQLSAGSGLHTPVSARARRSLAASTVRALAARSLSALGLEHAALCLLPSNQSDIDETTLETLFLSVASQQWELPLAMRQTKLLSGSVRDAHGQPGGCNLEYPMASLLRGSRAVATTGCSEVGYWPQQGTSVLPSWLTEDEGSSPGKSPPGARRSRAGHRSAATASLGSSAGSLGLGNSRHSEANAHSHGSLGLASPLKGMRRTIAAIASRPVDTLLLPRLVSSGPSSVLHSTSAPGGAISLGRQCAALIDPGTGSMAVAHGTVLMRVDPPQGQARWLLDAAAQDAHGTARSVPWAFGSTQQNALAIFPGRIDCVASHPSMPLLAVAWRVRIDQGSGNPSLLGRKGRKSAVSRPPPSSPAARFAGRAAQSAGSAAAPCVAVVHAYHGTVVAVMSCSAGVHSSGISALQFTPDGYFLVLLGRARSDLSAGYQRGKQSVSLWSWAQSASVPAIPFVPRQDVEQEMERGGSLPAAVAQDVSASTAWLALNRTEPDLAESVAAASMLGEKAAGLLPASIEQAAARSAADSTGRTTSGGDSADSSELEPASDTPKSSVGSAPLGTNRPSLATRTFALALRKERLRQKRAGFAGCFANVASRGRLLMCWEDVVGTHQQCGAGRAGQPAEAVGMSVVQTTVLVTKQTNSWSRSGSGHAPHESAKLTLDGGITVGPAPPSPSHASPQAESRQAYSVVLAGPGIRAVLGICVGAVGTASTEDTPVSLAASDGCGAGYNASSCTVHCSGLLDAPSAHFLGLPPSVPATPDGSDLDSDTEDAAPLRKPPSQAKYVSVSAGVVRPWFERGGEEDDDSRQWPDVVAACFGATDGTISVFCVPVAPAMTVRPDASGALQPIAQSIDVPTSNYIEWLFGGAYASASSWPSTGSPGLPALQGNKGSNSTTSSTELVAQVRPGGVSIMALACVRSNLDGASMSSDGASDGLVLNDAIDICVGSSDGTMSRWSVELTADGVGLHRRDTSSDTGPLSADEVDPRLSEPVPFPQSLSKCGTTLQAMQGAIGCLVFKSGAGMLPPRSSFDEGIAQRGVSANRAKSFKFGSAATSGNPSLRSSTDLASQMHPFAAAAVSAIGEVSLVGWPHAYFYAAVGACSTGSAGPASAHPASIARAAVGTVLAGRGDPMTAIASHPIFPVLLVGRQNGVLEAWDAQLGSRLCFYQLSKWGQAITAIDVSPDRSTIGVGLQSVQHDVIKTLSPDDAHHASHAPTLVTVKLAASMVEPPASAGGRQRLEALQRSGLGSGDLIRSKSSGSTGTGEEDPGEAETLVFGPASAVAVPQRGRTYPTCLRFAAGKGGFLAAGYCDGVVELLAPATGSGGRKEAARLLRKRQLSLVDGGASAVSSAGLGGRSTRSGMATPVRRQGSRTPRSGRSSDRRPASGGAGSGSRGKMIRGATEPRIVSLDFSSDFRALRIADASHTTRVWLPWSGSGKIAAPHEVAAIPGWASSSSLHGWESMGTWSRAAQAAAAVVRSGRYEGFEAEDEDVAAAALRHAPLSTCVGKAPDGSTLRVTGTASGEVLLTRTPTACVLTGTELAAREQGYWGSTRAGSTDGSDSKQAGDGEDGKLFSKLRRHASSSGASGEVGSGDGGDVRALGVWNHPPAAVWRFGTPVIGVAFVSGLEDEPLRHGGAEGSAGVASAPGGVTLAVLLAGGAGVVILRALVTQGGVVGRQRGLTDTFLAASGIRSPDAHAAGLSPDPPGRVGGQVSGSSWYDWLQSDLGLLGRPGPSDALASRSSAAARECGMLLYASLQFIQGGGRPGSGRGHTRGSSWSFGGGGSGGVPGSPLLLGAADLGHGDAFKQVQRSGSFAAVSPLIGGLSGASHGGAGSRNGRMRPGSAARSDGASSLRSGSASSGTSGASRGGTGPGDGPLDRKQQALPASASGTGAGVGRAANHSGSEQDEAGSGGAEAGNKGPGNNAESERGESPGPLGSVGMHGRVRVTGMGSIVFSDGPGSSSASAGMMSPMGGGFGSGGGSGAAGGTGEALSVRVARAQAAVRHEVRSEQLLDTLAALQGRGGSGPPGAASSAEGRGAAATAAVKRLSSAGRGRGRGRGRGAGRGRGRSSRGVTGGALAARPGTKPSAEV